MIYIKKVGRVLMESEIASDPILKIDYLIIGTVLNIN